MGAQACVPNTDPGVCPPLPHEGPGWGGAEEVGRGSGANSILRAEYGFGKREFHPPTPGELPEL